MRSTFIAAVAVLIWPNTVSVVAQEVTPPSGKDGKAPAQETAPGGPMRGPAVEPGYLGVIGDDRNDRGRGVRVVEVRPGGPAHQAGLLPGDLIVGVSGIRARQMSDMVAIIRQAPPGSAMTLDVLRNNEHRNIHVTLTHRPARQQTPDTPEKPPNDRHGGNPPAKLPDPFQLDRPQLPDTATEDRAGVELLQQRLDRLEQRMAKMEQSMVDLLKLLKGR